MGIAVRQAGSGGLLCPARSQRLSVNSLWEGRGVTILMGSVLLTLSAPGRQP